MGAPTRDTSSSQITWKFGLKILVRGSPWPVVLIFVLFKPLNMKIAFIAMFLIFRHMSHSKLSAKRPLKTACYFSSNLSFSPWQSVGSTWCRQLPVLSARYEYLTVKNSSNLSSIRLVWQVSQIGAPFTEKKIETKIAAANAGCRNKVKARQRKISRQQLSSRRCHRGNQKFEEK